MILPALHSRLGELPVQVDPLPKNLDARLKLFKAFRVSTKTRVAEETAKSRIDIELVRTKIEATLRNLGLLLASMSITATLEEAYLTENRNLHSERRTLQAKQKLALVKAATESSYVSRFQ
jgi:hypothetical protein